MACLPQGLLKGAICYFCENVIFHRWTHCVIATIASAEFLWACGVQVLWYEDHVTGENRGLVRQSCSHSHSHGAALPTIAFRSPARDSGDLSVTWVTQTRLSAAGPGQLGVRSAGGQDSWGQDSWGQDSWGQDSRGQDSWGQDSRGQDSWGQDSWGQDSWGQDSWGQDSWGRARGLTVSPTALGSRAGSVRLRSALSRYISPHQRRERGTPERGRELLLQPPWPGARRQREATPGRPSNASAPPRQPSDGEQGTPLPKTAEKLASPRSRKTRR